MLYNPVSEKHLHPIAQKKARIAPGFFILVLWRLQPSALRELGEAKPLLMLEIATVAKRSSA
jgi:hypothetical protein